MSRPDLRAARSHFDAAVAALRRTEGLLSEPFTEAKRKLALERLGDAGRHLSETFLLARLTPGEADPLARAADPAPEPLGNRIVALRQRRSPQ